MLVTLTLTVFVDLITAVAIGLILAGFVTARWIETEELKGITQLALPENKDSLSEAERTALKPNNGKIALLALHGRFSYASARELVQRIGMGISGYQVAIFDFTEAAHIGTSAALSIEAMLKSAQEEVKGVFVSGLTGFLPKKPSSGLAHSTTCLNHTSPRRRCKRSSALLHF